MTKRPVVSWKIEWLVLAEQGARRIPAFDFLTSIDHGVATRMLQIRDAVCQSGGPHKWLDTTTHDKMERDLDDLHEVRERQDQTLYRLYLKWVSATSTLWLIDGRTKPNHTALSKSEYDKIRALADLIDGTPPPAATVDDFAQAALAQQQGG